MPQLMPLRTLAARRGFLSNRGLTGFPPMPARAAGARLGDVDVHASGIHEHPAFTPQPRGSFKGIQPTPHAARYSGCWQPDPQGNSTGTGSRPASSGHSRHRWRRLNTAGA